MSTQRPLAIIAGAGPGLGKALMDSFEKAGFMSVGIRRAVASAEYLSEHQQLVSCDLSDAKSARLSMQKIIAEFGAPALVVHNTAALVIKPFLETDVEDFESCWRNTLLSAATLAQSVIPAMTDAGSGTLIFSGATASIRGGRNFSAFSSSKFALRGLAQSLAREFQPAGIHVAHVLLDGLIDTPASREMHEVDPEKMMNTQHIAAEYLRLFNQPRSTWTHELDLRPHTESF